MNQVKDDAWGTLTPCESGPQHLVVSPEMKQKMDDMEKERIERNMSASNASDQELTESEHQHRKSNQVADSKLKHAMEYECRQQHPSWSKRRCRRYSDRAMNKRRKGQG